MHISTDKSLLNIALIHDFLSKQAAWAKGIPLSTVQRSIQHSFCFGGYLDDQQIAFARVITDHATFAYLVDVFVIPEQRSKGYSKLLIQAIMDHDELQGLRRFMLSSSDARTLYQKFGFQAPAKPEILMEIHRPNLYRSPP